MPERVKVNLYIPAELAREYRTIAESYGEKRHWIAASTAMALLVQLDEVSREELADLISNIDRRGSMEDFVQSLLDKRTGMGKRKKVEAEIRRRGGKPSNKKTPPAAPKASDTDEPEAKAS